MYESSFKYTQEQICPVRNLPPHAKDVCGGDKDKTMKGVRAVGGGCGSVGRARRGPGVFPCTKDGALFVPEDFLSQRSDRPSSLFSNTERVVPPHFSASACLSVSLVPSLYQHRREGHSSPGGEVRTKGRRAEKFVAVG